MASPCWGSWEAPGSGASSSLLAAKTTALSAPPWDPSRVSPSSSWDGFPYSNHPGLTQGHPDAHSSLSWALPWYVETILSFDYFHPGNGRIHGGDNPSPQASQVSTSRPRLGQSSHHPPDPSGWVRREAPSPTTAPGPPELFPVRDWERAAGFIPTVLDRLGSWRFGNPRLFLYLVQEPICKRQE